MDAVTEALNAMQALHAEDDAMEAAIEQEFCEILKSREQTVEAMRAWVNQLDPDESLQKLAEFLSEDISALGSRRSNYWWHVLLTAERVKYTANAQSDAITSAARSNILRRRELAEKDAADAMQPWEGEP